MKLIFSIDLEEFDLPEEFSVPLTEDEQSYIGVQGADRVIKWAESNNFALTWYTTAAFALKNPDLIEKITSRNDEIALHGSRHNDNYSLMSDQKIQETLSLAKKNVESLTKKKVMGFRAPRFQKIPFAILKELSFSYASNLHPTWVPGRYCHLTMPRRPYQDIITCFPVSVTPLLRIPVSFMWFRMIPKGILKTLLSITARHDTYLHLYFHQWEFADIRHLNIPFWAKYNTGITLGEDILACFKNKTAQTLTTHTFLHQYFGEKAHILL
ncbi:MAG: DUF3473 domain-containing protein [Deltaproteobacteria bacterium]|nr:DUF3473 domain-containing protein [Deltaproteobacteria bacterium]